MTQVKYRYRSLVAAKQNNGSRSGRLPHGPAEPYHTSENLLDWMGVQFNNFGNIFKASVYGARVYVVCDPEYAQHVLVDNWENYEKGQAINRITFLLGNGIMVSEGEFWKRHRRIVQPAFHRKAIGALTQLMTTTNNNLLENWQSAAQRKGSVNVTRDVSHVVLEIVLKSIFGNDFDQVEADFNILCDVSERNLRFAQSFRPLRKKVLQLVTERRARGSTAIDILDMLMSARDHKSGEVMPDHELVNEIITLIVAGHETTAATLNWAWYLISQYPSVEAKLGDELNKLLGSDFPSMDEFPKFSYTRQVIDETLRLYPAGWLMTRRAMKDDFLGDYFVPAGTEIYIAPYFIQRNPNLWKDPDRFDPDRFCSVYREDRPRRAMLAFSAGPRNCVGELFARTEMQIHLMLVAKRLRLRYFQSNPIELDAGVNLRSKYDFIMTPEIKTNPN
jgi:cytochrome P450